MQLLGRQEKGYSRYLCTCLSYEELPTGLSRVQLFPLLGCSQVTARRCKSHDSFLPEYKFCFPLSAREECRSFFGRRFLRGTLVSCGDTLYGFVGSVFCHAQRGSRTALQRRLGMFLQANMERSRRSKYG